MNPAAQASPLAQAAEIPDSAPVTVLNTDYFAQILPDPPTVCGLRLKPLSIGRYRLMARFKVAFVAETNRTAAAGDLLIGALIGSMRCDEFKNFAASPGFSAEIQKWGAQAGFFPRRYFSLSFLQKLAENTRFGQKQAEKDAHYLLEQIRVFQNYVNEGAPDVSARFWSEPGDGSATGSHWSQSIEAVLREFQGWTREEIDEEPLTKALWDFYKHLENRGLGRFLSDEEAAELQKELTAEEIAQVKANDEKIREFLKERGQEVIQNG